MDRHARALGKRATAERSWLLCGGRPDRSLREMRFRPSFGWPQGFLDLGAALPLIIVVLSELERTGDTLALRLMGAGSTLRGALNDLGNTPAGAVRDALVRLVAERQMLPARRWHGRYDAAGRRGERDHETPAVRGRARASLSH